jgi:hypothetical protein
VYRTNLPDIAELTGLFVQSRGDKMFIEIEITGDPDEVVSHLMRSTRRGTEIFRGAKCNQILFKGKNIKDIIENAKEAALEGVRNALDDIGKM